MKPIVWIIVVVMIGFLGLAGWLIFGSGHVKNVNVTNTANLNAAQANVNATSNANALDEKDYLDEALNDLNTADGQ